MLVIDIPRIPPEGLDVDEALDAHNLHLEGETEFRLGPGARLACKVDLMDGTTSTSGDDSRARVATGCGRCLEDYELSVVRSWTSSTCRVARADRRSRKKKSS